MFVATLIAAPKGPGLAADAIAEIAGRLTGSAAAATWLDEGFSADIGFETAATDTRRAENAEIAAASGFDCVLQERTGRRKRFLIADMDSTRIDQECIDELAAEIGIKDRVAAITARAMNGEIAFEPAQRERVALLAGLPEATIGKVIDERITLAAGGRTLVATMRANGAHTALVSGGFTVFTDPIAQRLGFHENRANRLLAAGGKLTGAVAEPILGAAAKVEALREIGGRVGIGAQEVMAVGDGANDLPMLGLAGSGIALHAKPSVAAQARHRIDHGDLTALLFLQGYRRDEFSN